MIPVGAGLSDLSLRLLHPRRWPGVFRVVSEAGRAESAGADAAGFGVAVAEVGSAVGAFSSRGTGAGVAFCIGDGGDFDDGALCMHERDERAADH